MDWIPLAALPKFAADGGTNPSLDMILSVLLACLRDVYAGNRALWKNKGQPITKNIYLHTGSRMQIFFFPRVDEKDWKKHKLEFEIISEIWNFIANSIGHSGQT